MGSRFAAKEFSRKNKRKKFWKLLLKIGGFLAGILFLGVIGTFAYFAKDLPSPDKINKRLIPESTKIYDRTGQHLLYELHGEEKRTLVSSDQMGDYIKYATIVLEDKDFYHHQGIKFSSIIRAALKDVLQRGVAQGGSTITQQFIKNSILTHERTLARKVKEVILAIEIEQKFSKDEILQMYLNEIPYGSNAYGVEAAAQTFFNKSARELTIDESALLAGLPKAPTYYSPYGSHLERLKSRQKKAINGMEELGYITAEEAQKAREVDTLAKLALHRENIKAPHFVMYVIEYLEKKYGREALEENGMNVYTTLDWDKQEIAQRAVTEGVENNLIKWNAENAALVAIDVKTGQILTMVGSKDYFDTTIDGQVNVAIRERQPGSSFKPYVYLSAFVKGYTPETILFDVMTDFEKGSDKNYTPQNYDGSFHGPVKMKNALGMSLNVPAVKTLYLVGVKDAVKMAKKLGITTLNQPERYGLSLVLGGGEVKLLDHVNAFATLGNGGVKHTKSAILRIENKQGKVLEKLVETPGERVVEEKYVAMLDHVLSTNKYRAPAFGEQNPLRFDDRPVVAKTGTTNEFRDGWTMSYTPYLAVGVWAGNNDNRPMKIGAAGANVAAPILRNFLDQVLGNYDIENFPEYNKDEVLADIEKPILKGEIETEEKIKICEIPGKKDEYCLANKYCPEDEVKKRFFVGAHNILWYVKRDNPRGEYPENPENDSQFNRWEKAIERWYDNKEGEYIMGEPPEKECDKNDFKKYFPEVSLVVTKKTSSQLEIFVNVDAVYGVRRVNFYVNDEEINSISSKPYETVYDIPIDKNNSTLKIKVKLIDDNGNETDDSEDVAISF